MTHFLRLIALLIAFQNITLSSGQNFYGEPIPLSRCERSAPLLFQLIPANAPRFFPVRPASPEQLLRRIPRQQQSSVVQQVVINQQNAGGFNGGRRGFGGGFGGGFRHGGFGGHHGGFGSRPFFGRSYAEPDSTPQQMIEARPCSKNYVFSCRPTLSPAPCSTGVGGSGAY